MPLLAVLGVATACAADHDTDTAGRRDTDELTIEADAGDGTPPQAWTLTCADIPAGTHPDAAAACAHLEEMHDPFAPLPSDVACTEQFGGPQTAHVTGVWSGDQVDLELSRTDGCRISQWNGLGPLLPIAVG